MRGRNRSRVLLAMSGGVDSSVAAHLLKQAGYDVVGAFMRHGDRHTGGACETVRAPDSLPIVSPTPAHKQGCCSAADADDARKVAGDLDIPFYALDLHDEFGRMIDYFVDEYARGRTPNPCVMCNNWLKFGKLFEYADSIDAEYVATGHYAQIVPTAQGPALHRGLDVDKDQSYVLFGIERPRLTRMLLPLGGYQKSQIRDLADTFQLRVADKPDSQEICFVAPGQHPELVALRTGERRAGELVDTAGTVLGRHSGIENFTIGQRKGLGIALGEPHYVVRIDAGSRNVVLGRYDDLACSGLTAQRMNWLVPAPSDRFSCLAQIRYNSRPVAAQVCPMPEGRADLRFALPCHGVAPGQAVVLYQEAQVLGGGWIESSEPAAPGDRDGVAVVPS